MIKKILKQKVNLQFNNLNLLRLILATFVLFFHLNNIGQYRMKSLFVSWGDEAVRLFFIISGFLIYYSFDKDHALSKYASRRLFRIFPLYVLVILLQFLVMLYWAIADQNYTSNEILFGSIKYLGANLSLMNFLNYQLLGVLHGLSKAINGSLWSIKIEVMFYALIPILAFLFKSDFKKRFFILYILSLGIWYISYHYFPGMKAQLPAQLFWFLLGMFLYKYWNSITLGTIIKADTTILLIYFFCSWMQFDTKLLWEWLYFPAIAFTIVYLFSLERKYWGDLKNDISYGVYLLHYPIIVIFKYYGLLADRYWNSLMWIFPIVYLLSFGLHLLVEKPFMKMGRNFKFGGK